MTMSSQYSRRDLLRSCSAALALGIPPLRAEERLPVAPAVDQSSAFQRVTLEVSLKPFHDTSDEGIRKTCHEIFRSWAPLIQHCDKSAVMLWSADGSEILDYAGRMNDSFDWARYLGDANPPATPPANDPNRQGTHGRNWLYMPHPPQMTYGILRAIIRHLREIGRQATGKPVEIGATFDPGGEFAYSDFKFHRHPEVSTGTARGPNSWMQCTAKLNADSRFYAGFPHGIPAGTSVGTFFGRQSQHFLSDLGFDYIWFSNGFGFSLSPWAVTGPLFTGERFDAAAAPKLRDELLSFWRDFRAECPKFRIETRGSNLIVGADLSANASPVRDIYRDGFNLVAPPNSPWAALDGDFGLELVGYLSRIAELPPGNVYPFRFYTHDPWWLNSPWLDRYGREPHDIYLPLALARVNEDATITRPAYLEFLTIDNSWGQMPDKVPIEVTHHILSAMEDYSDAPGLVTWIYPFDEYHDMTFGAKRNLPAVFFGDWFMRGAVNNGFPLNTVVSTRQFAKAFASHPETFRSTILLAYLPAISGQVESMLVNAVRQGFNVLAYGPIANPENSLVRALHLKRVEPISGDLQLHREIGSDTVLHGEMPKVLRHRPELSAGGIDTVVSSDAGSQIKICAAVIQGKAERAYAVSRPGAFGPGSGTLAWIRGTFSSAINGSRLPMPDNPNRWVQAESVIRLLLAEFGYSIHFNRETLDSKCPLILGARHTNGWFLSSYSPSTTAEVKLRFPHGAPILLGMETWLENGYSSYRLPRAAHKEVRCLVDQKESSEVSCVEAISEYPFIKRRLLVKGLRNATVHVYPPGGERIVIRANDTRPFMTDSTPYSSQDNGKRLVVSNVTGQLNIAW